MKSFLSYLGGKSSLTGKIIPLIPKHTCYCEVFAGAAWLLFKKEESEVEIINDINTDLVTLYRVVKHHLEEFIRYLKWILVARDEFARFKLEEPDTLTDIQRAVRFFYLLKNAYSSKLVGQCLNISTYRTPAFNLLRIEEELSAVHLRLHRVYIENRPYEKIIERYDRPHTFFYLDPPYYGCESDYGPGIFKREDFQRLRDMLAQIKGRYILSINDIPEIRRLYKGLRMESVSTTYNVSGAKKTKAKELLIMNFQVVLHRAVWR
ncbi:methyl-directed repair dna adenine methylase [hydrocarbon metagenome]|uniref:site-specific DNA-methyltransferase (adenine-specific) n=1 Tax=hydrocarbon metagenome TaxID=938273 RepID=A0A0W8FV14_9ZZZZ